MVTMITTFFGIGRLRPAPGTWGSAAAVLLAVLMAEAGAGWFLPVATVLATVLGFWAVALAIAGSADKDPSEIVIDEVAGQWIALWPLSLGLNHAGVDPWLFPWPGWLGAFLAYRLFDIWKPGPIGWADRQPGATGVMLDDLIAGVAAALTVAVAAFIAHGVVGV